MFLRIHGHLSGVNGFGRVLIAFALGTLSAFCQAPFDAYPILWITFPSLIWLLDSTRCSPESGQNCVLSSSFLVGWSFGFGYFLSGFWWSGLAFFVEAEKYGWMAPVAIASATAFFALFWGVATAVAGFFWYPDWRRILVLTVALSIAEYLRGNYLPGFPWNSPGYAFMEFWVSAQFAAVVGLFGLNFLAFFIFSFPAAFAFGSEFKGKPGVWLAGTAFTCLIVMFAFGIHRLNLAESVGTAEAKLRIVQPNVPQEDKWKVEKREEILNKLVGLSSLDLEPDVAVIVWPETAIPFLMTEEIEIIPLIAKFLPENAHLITGAIRREKNENAVRYYNSALVFGRLGLIVDVYDKVRLMPFGEYIPLVSMIEFLGFEGLAEAFSGLMPGSERRNLNIQGIPAVSPLICYEIIFPNAVTAEDEPSKWMVNVTNDAWFGNTPGPYQHLAQSRLRAIEEGIPVIRSANSGISAIIDSNGRVGDQLKINRAGVLDGYLPAPNSTEGFAFSRRYGHIILCMLAIFFIGLGNCNLIRPRK